MGVGVTEGKPSGKPASRIRGSVAAKAGKPGGYPVITGVFRVSGDAKSLLVTFDRPLTDNDARHVHELLRGSRI